MTEEFNKFDSMTNSVRHFERVMRTVMNVQNRQGDRIKLTIRTGMAFLAIIGILLYVMLHTMSVQIERVSDAVGQMNQSFDVVAERMARVDKLMTSLEQNVGLLPAIGSVMPGMDSEMSKLTATIAQMRAEMDAINTDVNAVRIQSENMSNISAHMSDSIRRMNGEVNHMAQPARSINKMFPFMP